MASINYYVVRNRNQASDLAVLHFARQIQTATQTLTDTLHRLGRGWPYTGTSAALARLSAQLRQYDDTIQKFVPDYAPLSQPSAARAMTGWFGELDLRATPAPVAAAALTRLETQVRQVTAEALENQAQKAGSCWDGFDRIGAFAIPISNTVAPGKQYEAQLILSLAASSSKLRMLANGRALTVDPAGQGLFTFRVPPARPGQPDTVRAQWRGEIRYNPFGIDTVQRLTVPYLIVRRPQL